jgi:hypothetical protein
LEICDGIDAYTERSGGYLPPLQDIRALAAAQHCDPNREPFISPIGNEPYRTNPYYSNAKVTNIPMARYVALVYDPRADLSGYHVVLFAKYGVGLANDAEWAIIKRYSHIK